MWSFLLPLLRKIFSNIIPETLQDWAAAFVTATVMKLVSNNKPLIPSSYCLFYAAAALPVRTSGMHILYVRRNARKCDWKGQNLEKIFRKSQVSSSKVHFLYL